MIDKDCQDQEDASAILMGLSPSHEIKRQYNHMREIQQRNDIIDNYLSELILMFDSKYQYQKNTHRMLSNALDYFRSTGTLTILYAKAIIEISNRHMKTIPSSFDHLNLIL